MNRTLSICYVTLATTLAAFAADNRRDIEVIAPASAAVLAAAFERVDVAIARSVITPNVVKGAFAEGLTNHFILSDTGGVGQWHAISPRLGPQGLDHVAVRMNSQGHPIGLMVGETKYDTSPLGTTKSGIQMGSRHTSDRLAGLAARLKKISGAVEQGISTQPKPHNPNYRVEVLVPLDEKTSSHVLEEAGSSW